VVGLSRAAVHDVPHRWRNELRRVVVDVSDEGFVRIRAAFRGAIVHGEANSAASVAGVSEAVDVVDIDLESETAKAELRVYVDVCIVNIRHNVRCRESADSGDGIVF
jgi:hypothetical protein